MSVGCGEGCGLTWEGVGKEGEGGGEDLGVGRSEKDMRGVEQGIHGDHREEGGVGKLRRSLHMFSVRLAP